MSLIQNDQWNDNYLATDVFQYTFDEFRSLRGANFGVTLISLASSTAVVIAYIYMFFCHRKEANRVSLRCVFLCCLSDTVNSVLNLVLIRIRGESSFCQAASILIEFSNVWTASLLTLVGINLVLIFVVNVKRRDLLEKFYFVSVLVYSLIAESASIYTEITVTDQSSLIGTSCWYHIYIADRTLNLFSWMWFYGFIFFVNLIAICCSIIAMNKLLREQKLLAQKMDDIALSTNFSCIDTESHFDNSIKKKQNSVFSTVVLRCILYPLVPFLVNIFGFILQLIITSNSNQAPGYALSMLDVIFSNIGGFFVAILFFTDPAITSVMKSAHAEWREKYVEEYILVSKEDVKRYTELSSEVTVASSPNNAVESSSPSDNNNPIFIQSPSPAIITQSNRYSGSKDDVYNSIYRANRNQEGTLHIHQRKKDDLTMPMRRILIHTPNLNKKRRSTSSHLAGSVSTLAIPDLSRSSQILSFQKFSIEDAKEIYIPYRFPRLARFAHFILTLFGGKKRVSTLITMKKNAAKSASTTGVNSYMTDEDDENIIIPYKTDTTDAITPIKEEDYFCDDDENDTSSTNSPNSNTKYM